jgi:hypothetical protein
LLWLPRLVGLRHKHEWDHRLLSLGLRHNWLNGGVCLMLLLRNQVLDCLELGGLELGFKCTLAVLSGNLGPKLLLITSVLGTWAKVLGSLAKISWALAKVLGPMGKVLGSAAKVLGLLEAPVIIETPTASGNGDATAGLKLNKVWAPTEVSLPPVVVESAPVVLVTASGTAAPDWADAAVTVSFTAWAVFTISCQLEIKCY